MYLCNACTYVELRFNSRAVIHSVRYAGRHRGQTYHEIGREFSKDITNDHLRVPRDPKGRVEIRGTPILIGAAAPESVNVLLDVIGLSWRDFQNTILILRGFNTE